ncbi:MAG: hypothetical protein U0840_21440 [Gemmataceae bacterium]
MRRTYRVSGRDGVKLLLPSPYSKVFFDPVSQTPFQRDETLPNLHQAGSRPMNITTPIPQGIAQHER